MTDHSVPLVLPTFSDTDDETIEQIVNATERWHGEAHDGCFQFCYRRPCREINGIVHGLHL